jgi:hypothetical protein
VSGDGRDRPNGGIPSEALAELRASVRALRGELERRFGVGEVTEPPAEPELEPEPPPEPEGWPEELPAPGSALDADAAPGWLERTVRELRARLDEFDVVKVYEALRERVAIPGRGECSSWRTPPASSRGTR